MTPLAALVDTSTGPDVRPPVVREFTCPHCRRVQFDYAPPIRWLRMRCRRCGAWITLTDAEEVAA